MSTISNRPWDIEKIEANFEALSSGDLTLIKKIWV